MLLSFIFPPLFIGYNNRASQDVKQLLLLCLGELPARFITEHAENWAFS
tara:strand:+ start:465 stop:611 length:147 start_codon:yes stop_codon:yes gene_type:complete